MVLASHVSLAGPSTWQSAAACLLPETPVVEQAPPLRLGRRAREQSFQAPQGGLHRSKAGLSGAGHCSQGWVTASPRGHRRLLLEDAKREKFRWYGWLVRRGRGIDSVQAGRGGGLLGWRHNVGLVHSVHEGREFLQGEGLWGSRQLERGEFVAHHLLRPREPCCPVQGGQLRQECRRAAAVVPGLVKCDETGIAGPPKGPRDGRLKGAIPVCLRKVGEDTTDERPLLRGVPGQPPGIVGGQGGPRRPTQLRGAGTRPRHHR
ncbi:hypothetical protein E2C01_078823 [Portunus trituberculatus]|uniref:Uncharacterized protein n=1 Tax=Portunus trituberculatus TaxID=210409 RepID=A0A5B7INQ4_PORTR|nr:hypothetical protein [Portunus trituberculatus]